MSTSASIHGSSVHSVKARATVSSGGPWYPMPVTLPGWIQEPLPEPGRTAAMYMIWTGLVQPLEVFGR